MTSSSKEQIVQQFRDGNCIAYHIFDGKKLRARYDPTPGANTEDGEESLLSWLSSQEDGNFEVKMYTSIPKSGINEKTPCYVQLNYRVRYSTESKNQYWQEKGLGGHMIEEIRSLKAEIAGLKQQMEESPEDEELEKEAEANGLGMVGTIINHPVISALLANMAANMFTNNQQPNTPPQHQQNYPRVQAMAGIEDDSQLNKTISSLLSKGVTISDFQKLDDMPEAKLNMLLTMLRAQ